MAKETAVKKWAVFLALIMLAIVVWALYADSGVTLIVNGAPITGALKGAVGVTGVMVASVALLCFATFLAFVFAGVGLVILGGFVLIGLIIAWLIFPFLLLLLIPLALVWGFVAVTRKA